MGYQNLTVKDFLKGVRNGSIDLQDFYRKFFVRVKQVDREHKLLVTLAEKEAFQQLRTVKKGKLHSLPVSVKDCLCTEGIQSTAGSQILKGYKPPFDATAVERIKHAGGVVVGKTQQDEFGFGTFSVNSGFSIPRNPLDPSRTCGGSSGGAAGLTRALELPHVALAESTGGSISCPASFCGVVGLTPTYGLVSRWGLIDYANSLDKVGVLGRRVEDAGMVLNEIASFDTKDFTSVKRLSVDYTKFQDVRRMKVGIPKEYFAAAREEVVEKVMDGMSALETAGAIVEEVSLPNTRYALAAYYVMATAEASTNLARYCGMRYGPAPPPEGHFDRYFSGVRTKYFGQEAKRRILLGTFARMAGYRGKYYLKAFKVRSLVIRDFERVFKKVDALIAPTMPLTAPTFKEIEQLKPLEQYQMDTLTVGPSLAGIPQLSVPCGSVKGMPVGMHILGDHLQEQKILSLGREYEKMTGGKG